MGDAIVVGTDGSKTARVAVAEAMRLAGKLDVPVHVVSAYEPLRGARVSGAPDSEARGWSPMSDAEVDATLSEIEVMGRTREIPVTTHAKRHDPVDAILGVADEVDAGMIVVGSRGMHGARRLSLGNVPNQISHKAHCNVLIVNTDGRV
jgi:nucleotide-binding universal stress UspA family protein